jgi:hypothetical protein
MMLGSLLGGALYVRAPGLPFLVTGAANVLSIGLAIAFYRVRSEGPIAGDLPSRRHSSLEGTDS